MNTTNGTTGGRQSLAIMARLDLIDPSELNARITFDEVKLDELGQTILAEGGLLQPLVCRRKPDGVRLEVIIGERRRRASVRVGLDEVPVIVRENVSDAEFLELNLVENLQREDLDPIECAKQIGRMLELEEEGGAAFTVTSLAAKLGKDANFIHAAANLLKVPQLFPRIQSGEVAPVLAGMIGSLPPSMHARAIDEMIEAQFGAAMSEKEGRKWIADNYRRDLRRAQFDKEEENLIDSAGACSRCPFWGGNREEITGKNRVHVCLDPECFTKKQGAVQAIIRKHAEEEGTRILDERTSRGIFPSHQDGLAWDAPFVELRESPSPAVLKPGEKAPPTWEKILAGASVPVVIGFDAEGRARRLAEIKPALAAAAQSPFAGIFKPNAGTNIQTAEDKRADAIVKRAENAASEATLHEGLAEFLQGMSAAPWSLKNLRLLLGEVLSHSAQKDGRELVLRVLRPDLKKIGDLETALEAELDKRTRPEEILGLIALGYVARNLRFYGFRAPTLPPFARAFDFDAGRWEKLADERVKAAGKEARAAGRNEEGRKAGKGKRKTPPAAEVLAQVPAGKLRGRARQKQLEAERAEGLRPPTKRSGKKSKARKEAAAGKGKATRKPKSKAL